MSIEIRELIIQARIEPSSPPPAGVPQEKVPQSLGRTREEELKLINKITRRVLEQLRMEGLRR